MMQSFQNLQVVKRQKVEEFAPRLRKRLHKTDRHLL